ncbi:TrmH family RNA methyltransferase, partial [Pseudomonas syringae]|uniref:TrmH family RNA methyltransferase n=1 Tax=Pseudomonas syringae TaxID=317 RepID=UPI0034D55B7E
HNVGSLFRTADGAGVTKIYLAGYSPLPLDKFGRISKPQKEIAKTALGAEKTIPYEYFPTLKEIVKKLKKEKFVVIGLEQD